MPTESANLLTQHAVRMRRIILPSVVCLAQPYFSTLSKKRHDFLKKKKVIGHKIRVLIFSTTRVWNISHSKKNWERYFHKCTYAPMYIGLHVNYQILLSVLKDFEFSGQSFGKNIQISNFTKICPFWAELFHADGRTDMTKLTAAFRNFAKTPQNLNTSVQCSQVYIYIYIYIYIYL